MKKLRQIIKYIDWSHASVMVLIILLVFFAHGFVMDDVLHSNMLEIQNLLQQKGIALNRMLHEIEDKSMELSHLASEGIEDYEDMDGGVVSDLLARDFVSKKMQSFIQTNKTFSELNVFYVHRSLSGGTGTIIQFFDQNRDGIIEAKSYDSMKSIIANQKVQTELDDVMEEMKPVWSSGFELNDSYGNDRPFVIYATPITKEGVKGLIAIALPLSALQEQIETDLLGGYFSILDSKYRVVIHPTFRLDTDIGTAFNGAFTDMVEAIKQEPEAGDIVYDWVDDRQKRMFYQRLFNGWSICFAVFDDALHTGEPLLGLWIVVAVSLIVVVGITAIYRERQVLRLWRELMANGQRILNGEDAEPIADGLVMSPKKKEFVQDQFKAFQEVRVSFSESTSALLDEVERAKTKNVVLEEMNARLNESWLQCSEDLSAKTIEVREEITNGMKHLQQSESLLRCLFRISELAARHSRYRYNEGDFIRTLIIILDIIRQEVERANMDEDSRLHVEDAIETMKTTIEETAYLGKTIPIRMDSKVRSLEFESDWFKDIELAVSPFLESVGVRCHWIHGESGPVVNEMMFFATVSFFSAIIRCETEGVNMTDDPPRVLVRHETDGDMDILLLQEFSILQGHALEAFQQQMMMLADSHPSCGFKIETLQGGHAVTISSESV